MAGVKGRSGGARPNSGPKKKTEAQLIDELKRIDEEIAKRAGERAAPIKAEAEKEVEKSPALSVAEKRAVLNELFPINDEDPLKFLLNVMQEPLLSVDLRVKAAMKAVEFKHKKPGEAGKKEELNTAADGVAKGSRFGTSAPPAHLRNNGTTTH